MTGANVTIVSQGESPMSSIEIEARAKGAPKVTVKVYVQPGDEEAGKLKAIQLFDAVEANYAHLNGDGSTPVRDKRSRRDGPSNEVWEAPE